jgi:PAS domain S-box-containing protein
MKKPNRQSWLFPNCFFLFFSIYLLVKFLFVFFFMAAYEPLFLYHLTPFYLLSGFSNIQLLSLALGFMVFDTYLHLWSSRRKLLLSFLPSSLMVAGIGYSIMYNPLDLSYALHYALFGCLLAVILIDYQYVLKDIQPSTLPHKKDVLTTRMMEGTLTRTKTNHLFARNEKRIPQPVPSPVTVNLAEFNKISNGILQKMQVLLDDLERKTFRVEQLETAIEARKEHTPSLKTLSNLTSLPPESKEPRYNIQKNQIQTISPEDTIILKEKIQNHLVIDGINDVVAVVQRGFFKEISNSFAGFLGYQRTELLQKNFFVFIAPRGFEDARKYYLNRLKGVTSNSFRTVLLTKDNVEVLVEITISPTIYKGDSAEFLSVTQVKNES